jgi:putative (di)nucleoside polyphosphate hydrolase
MTSGRYRPNVCAVIQKQGTKKLLLCHRKGYPPALGWQFPQGGIDEKAGLISEMKRELREEIGTDDVKVLEISPHFYRYEFPPHAAGPHAGFKGQIQQWVLAEFSGNDSKINFAHEPAEFDGFQWVDPLEVIGRVVDFKRETYSMGMHDLRLL